MALEQFQHHEQKPPPGMDSLTLLRNEVGAAVTAVDFWETMKDIEKAEKELPLIRGGEGDGVADERALELEAIKKELDQRYKQKFGGSLLH